MGGLPVHGAYWPEGKLTARVHTKSGAGGLEQQEITGTTGQHPCHHDGMHTVHQVCCCTASVQVGTVHTCSGFPWLQRTNLEPDCRPAQNMFLDTRYD
jgi:hypothetical protein